jgi:plasmid stabilization system protein ParE
VKKVIFSEEARREFFEAAAWFKEHSILGVETFADVMHETLGKMAELPFAAPVWSYAPKYRAWTLKRLHYRVIYQVTDEIIRIVALIHTSRDPRAWLRRLK